MKKLIVLISLSFLLFSSCSEDESVTKSTQSFNERSNGSFTLTPSKAIIIENPIGPIIIEGNAAKLSADWFLDKNVFAESNQAANEVLKNIFVVKSSNNDTIYIKVQIPADVNSGSTSLSLTLPNSTPVLVNTVKGNCNVSYLNTSFSGYNLSEATIKAHNGNLNLTGSGSKVDVELALPNSGICKIDYSAGDIDFKIPNNSSAQLSAFTADGGVFYTGVNINVASQTVNNLTGQIGNGDGTIDIKTGSGNINIENIQ